MDRLNLYVLFTCFVPLMLMSCSEYDNSLRLEELDSGNYIIAHRGNWSQKSIPENSIAAFKSSLNLDIYAVEFDVQQSVDGVLVINHDAIYHGCEISNTTYDDLSSYLLDNGERLPTLNDFFSIYKSSNSEILLFVELKTCNVEDVVKLVDTYNMQDKVIYTSFNLDYLDHLVGLGLGDNVIFVGGYLTPLEVKMRGYSGFAYHDQVFNSHEEWISEGINLNLNVCVWTIDNLFRIKQFADKRVRVYTNKVSQCVKNIKK